MRAEGERASPGRLGLYPRTDVQLAITGRGCARGCSVCRSRGCSRQSAKQRSGSRAIRSGVICAMTGQPHRLFWRRSEWCCEDCRQKIESCCDGCACPPVDNGTRVGRDGVSRRWPRPVSGQALEDRRSRSVLAAGPRPIQKASRARVAPAQTSALAQPLASSPASRPSATGPVSRAEQGSWSRRRDAVRQRRQVCVGRREPARAWLLHASSSRPEGVAPLDGGLKGLVHRLIVRWAWLAAGRAKGWW